MVLSEEEISSMQKFVMEHDAATEDPQQLRTWADDAKERLKMVIAREQRRSVETGGEHGEKLRSVVEAAVLAKVGDRVQLTPGTKLVSQSVQMLPQGVFVDIRLQLGVVRV